MKPPQVLVLLQCYWQYYWCCTSCPLHHCFYLWRNTVPCHQQSKYLTFMSGLIYFSISCPGHSYMDWLDTQPNTIQCLFVLCLTCNIITIIFFSLRNICCLQNCSTFVWDTFNWSTHYLAINDSWSAGSESTKFSKVIKKTLCYLEPAHSPT